MMLSGAKGSLGVAQAWRAIEAPLWGPTGWVYKGGKIPRRFGRASVKDSINLSTAFTTQRAYGKPLVTDLSLCDTLHVRATPLTDAFKTITSNLKFRLHNLTKEDIRTYVSEHLKTHPQFLELEDAPVVKGPIISAD
ncbi:hypothetical protein F4804DRAFT_278641 [Jackrogersella minutella]|nr:hypothetical protein F4804DRAFT_278641 [Jackrogersella minutella]